MKIAVFQDQNHGLVVLKNLGVVARIKVVVVAIMIAKMVLSAAIEIVQKGFHQTFTAAENQH